MTTVLRLGVLGLGKAGRRHVEATKRVNGVSLVAVADASEQARGRASSGLDCRVERGLDGLLKNGPPPDAVVVALPHALLASASHALVERGIHVLVEKPMATSLEAARRLVEAAKLAKARVMVGYNHRFRREYVAAKQWLDAGAVGAPRLLVEQMIAPDGPLPPWVWDPEIADGGMLTYNGAHVIDHLMWLAGEPVTAVCAATASLHFDERLEDTAAAWLRFASGAFGSVVVHKSNVPHAQAVWETRVLGTEGALRVASDGAHLSTAGRDEKEPAEVDPDQRFVRALGAFVEAIADERDPDPDGQQGVEVLACLKALYRSATAGGWVMLEERPSRSSA